MQTSNIFLAALICVGIFSVSYGQLHTISMDDVAVNSELDTESPGDMFDRAFNGLAFDSSARKQLGLSDDQIAQLLRSNNERADWFVEEYMTRYRQLSNPTQEQTMEIRSEVLDVLHRRARAQIEDILLPHQTKILQGMAVNKIVDKAGTASLLKSRWLQVELGIDDEQMAKIRERAEKEAEILRASIEELKSKFVENVLSELTPNQRDKVTGLLPESKQEVSKKQEVPKK